VSPAALDDSTISPVAPDVPLITVKTALAGICARHAAMASALYVVVCARAATARAAAAVTSRADPRVIQAGWLSAKRAQRVQTGCTSAS
jgi:hypothetical protein